MLLCVGLGNPGSAYAGTRHNIGYEVLGRLATRLDIRFREGTGDYLIAETSVEEKDIALILPTTFMNRSGLAVLDVMEQFQTPPERLLVVSDEFQLPLGSVRLRKRGSDGGHNGLASIIYQLQTDAFPRLRCGVGSPPLSAEGSLATDFVLGQFEQHELPAVRIMVDRAADACLSVLQDGIETAMSRFNARPEQSSS